MLVKFVQNSLSKARLNLEQKIAQGLERLSDVYKVLFIERAKQNKLSPIQLQIIAHVSTNLTELNSVSYLSKNFNLTKATISDAVKSLTEKGYVLKVVNKTDSRSYHLTLSAKGKKLANELQSISHPIEEAIAAAKIAHPDKFYKDLSNLIFQLHQNGTIQVQRTCFACKFYANSNEKDYCNFLKKPLLSKDIQIDCFDFKPSNAQLHE